MSCDLVYRFFIIISTSLTQTSKYKFVSLKAVLLWKLINLTFAICGNMLGELITSHCRKLLRTHNESEQSLRTSLVCSQGLVQSRMVYTRLLYTSLTRVQRLHPVRLIGGGGFVFDYLPSRGVNTLGVSPLLRLLLITLKCVVLNSA